MVLARLKQKRKVLSDMLADSAMSSVIVRPHQHGADRVVRDLERDGFNAAVIHGNKSQNARQKALNGRDGSVRILVATDIAARGIDVPGISHVVNFDLPDEAESLPPSAAPAVRDGIAITLVDPAENAKLRLVERIIRMKLPVAATIRASPIRKGLPESAMRRCRRTTAASSSQAGPRAQPHHRGQGPKRQDGHKNASMPPNTAPAVSRSAMGRSSPGFGHKQHAGKPEGGRHEAGRPTDGAPGKKPFRRKRRGGFGSGKPARAA